MDKISSLGVLQLSFKNENSIIAGSKNKKDQTLNINVDNELTAILTNSSRTERLTLYYDKANPIPDIWGEGVYKDCPRIYVYFPVGEKPYMAMDLEQAEKICCSVSTGWKVEKKKDNKLGVYWVIIPDTQDDDLTFYPGDNLFLSFSNFHTFKNPINISCMVMQVRDFPNMESMEAYLPFTIEWSKPIVRLFHCNQNSVGILDKVHFEWSILGVIKESMFLPFFGNEAKNVIDAKGNTDCLVTESTNYTIAVRGEKEVVYGFCPVTVEEPKILLLTTNEGKLEYMYGEDINLLIQLANTNHCYIDNGIGRVDFEPTREEGALIVKSTFPVTCKSKKSKFTVSCLGKKQLINQSITIQITDFLDIVNIIYNRTFDINKKSYRYFLCWEVENATSLYITTSDGQERTGNTEDKVVLSGQVVFYSDQSEAMSIDIYAIGHNGQKINTTRDCEVM